MSRTTPVITASHPPSSSGQQQQQQQHRHPSPFSSRTGSPTAQASGIFRTGFPMDVRQAAAAAAAREHAASGGIDAPSDSESDYGAVLFDDKSTGGPATPASSQDILHSQSLLISSLQREKKLLLDENMQHRATFRGMEDRIRRVVDVLGQEAVERAEDPIGADAIDPNDLPPITPSVESALHVLQITEDNVRLFQELQSLAAILGFFFGNVDEALSVTSEALAVPMEQHAECVGLFVQSLEAVHGLLEQTSASLLSKQPVDGAPTEVLPISIQSVIARYANHPQVQTIARGLQPQTIDEAASAGATSPKLQGAGVSQSVTADQISALQSEVAKLQLEKDALSQAAEENAALQSDVKRLQQTNAALSRSANAEQLTASQIASLQSEISQLTSENTSLAQRSSSQLSSLQTEVAQLQLENASLSSQAQQVEALQHENATLTKRNVSLAASQAGGSPASEQSHPDSALMRAQIQSQVDTMQAEILQLKQAHAAELEAMKKEYEAELEDAQAAASAVASSSAATASSSSSSSSSVPVSPSSLLAQANSRRLAANARCHALAAEKAQIKTELEAVRKEKEELERKYGVQQLEKSTAAATAGAPSPDYLRASLAYELSQLQLERAALAKRVLYDQQQKEAERKKDWLKQRRRDTAVASGGAGGGQARLRGTSANPTSHRGSEMSSTSAAPVPSSHTKAKSMAEIIQRQRSHSTERPPASTPPPEMQEMAQSMRTPSRHLSAQGRQQHHAQHHSWTTPSTPGGMRGAQQSPEASEDEQEQPQPRANRAQSSEDIRRSQPSDDTKPTPSSSRELFQPDETLFTSDHESSPDASPAGTQRFNRSSSSPERSNAATATSPNSTQRFHASSSLTPSSLLRSPGLARSDLDHAQEVGVEQYEEALREWEREQRMQQGVSAITAAGTSQPSGQQRPPSSFNQLHISVHSTPRGGASPQAQPMTAPNAPFQSSLLSGGSGIVISPPQTMPHRSSGPHSIGGFTSSYLAAATPAAGGGKSGQVKASPTGPRRFDPTRSPVVDRNAAMQDALSQTLQQQDLLVPFQTTFVAPPPTGSPSSSTGLSTTVQAGGSLPPALAAIAKTSRTMATSALTAKLRAAGKQADKPSAAASLDRTAVILAGASTAGAEGPPTETRLRSMVHIVGPPSLTVEARNALASYKLSGSPLDAQVNPSFHDAQYVMPPSYHQAKTTPSTSAIMHVHQQKYVLVDATKRVGYLHHKSPLPPAVAVRNQSLVGMVPRADSQLGESARLLLASPQAYEPSGHGSSSSSPAMVVIHPLVSPQLSPSSLNRETTVPQHHALFPDKRTRPLVRQNSVLAAQQRAQTEHERNFVLAGSHGADGYRALQPRIDSRWQNSSAAGSTTTATATATATTPSAAARPRSRPASPARVNMRSMLGEPSTGSPQNRP
jgi:hypothetical protein